MTGISTENVKPRIAYIGVGDMGGPLALRLMRAGFPVTVCDRNPEAIARLRDAGADVAATPAEAASAAEIVLACMPSPAVSEAVALGPDGVIHGTRVKVYGEMSTIGQATMQRIAAGMKARGVGLLDAPVSGGPAAVTSGKLTCFVAGAESDFDFARAALEGLSDRLFRVGETPGQSQVLKLANNLLNAANLTVACEMLRMAMAAGIDMQTALDVINVSTGRSRATEETLMRHMVTGKFATGARLEILHKDVALALAAAEGLGVSHVVADGVLEVWDGAMAAGRAREDLSRIYDFVASLATSTPHKEASHGQ